MPTVWPIIEAHSVVPVFLTRVGSETTRSLKRASAGSGRGRRDSGGGSGDIGSALIVIAILPPDSLATRPHPWTPGVTRKFQSPSQRGGRGRNQQETGHSPALRPLESRPRRRRPLPLPIAVPPHHDGARDEDRRIRPHDDAD